MLKFILVIVVSLVLAVPGLLLAQDKERIDLDKLVAEAIRNNPQLRSASNEKSAARAKIGQATAWDAPQVGVEFFQTPVPSFPNPLKNGMETDYYISQMFPFPGKLAAMGSAAESNANMVEQGYQALERKVILELKNAYYELYLAQRKIQINAENQDLMRKFVEIARKQYEVGMGSHHDILRAQTELSTLINDGVILQREKKVVESMLNTTLSRPADAPLGYVPDIESDIPQWTFGQMRSLVLESRPELKSMKFNIEMNKADLASSRREYFPDLMIRFTYKNMTQTTPNYWAAMAGVSIPLAPWSSGRYTSKVEENELNVKKAEDDYQSMENMTLYEVQDALVKVQSNQNLASLYKNTVIPQAEQTLESTISAYQTGKTEFLMLIDAYRMVLMSKLDYHMAVMSYMSSQAQLEQAVGMSTAEIKTKVQE